MTHIRVRCVACLVSMSAPESCTDPCPHCGGQLEAFDDAAARRAERASLTLFGEL